MCRKWDFDGFFDTLYAKSIARYTLANKKRAIAWSLRALPSLCFTHELLKKLNQNFWHLRKPNPKHVVFGYCSSVCHSLHQGSILNFSYVSLRSSYRGMAANENFKISTLTSLLVVKSLYSGVNLRCLVGVVPKVRCYLWVPQQIAYKYYS